MKTLILLGLLISFTLCLHLERQHQRKISKQCCLSKGGFQCGNIVKDCCVIPEGVTKDKVSSDICKKQGIFGSSQICPGQKITQQCIYCSTVCESKGGKLCGWQNKGNQQCCPEKECIPNIGLDLKMKTCKEGTLIQLTDCIADMNLSDKVFAW